MAIMSIVCQMAELLIYCWFGQLVLNEVREFYFVFPLRAYFVSILPQAYHLQTTLYNLQWYDFGLNEQKMIKLMIMRAQTPCGLAAYNYFACDLPTFFNVRNIYFGSKIINKL